MAFRMCSRFAAAGLAAALAVSLASPGRAGDGRAPKSHDPPSTRSLDPSQAAQSRVLPPWAGALEWIQGRAATSLPDRAPSGLATDPRWQPKFGLPVPDRWISTLLPYGDLLIAGGIFRRIGHLEAPGIAAWDGARWSPLGAFPGLSVMELATEGSDLLALGVGNEGGGVWRWNGTIWESLGALPVPAWEVMDMAVDGGSVAVSVATFEEGGVWRSHVLLHAQGTWSILGDAFSPGPDRSQGIVSCLAWYRHELHAGGDFGRVGDTECRHIARWDGSSWQQAGEGLGSSSFSVVQDLAAFNDELVAYGAFELGSDPVPRTFARWNGSSWSALDSFASNAAVSRLRAVGSDLYALGSFRDGLAAGSGIARWDGTAWHTGEDGFLDRVMDVAPFQGRLHAGGSLAADGSRPATPLMRREASGWEIPQAPGPAMHGFLGRYGPFVRSLLVTDRGIIAAGPFDFAGTAGGWRRCVGGARWDGSEWSSLGLESMADCQPFDMTLHKGVVYAVGSFASHEGDYITAIRIDDHGWQPVGDSRLQMSNTYCIASALGDLFVGGHTDASYGGIARWDGSAWRSVGGGLPQDPRSYIAAISPHGADVIVAGSFAEIGGVAASNIAAWNPTTGWRALGNGVDKDVTDLLSRDGILYASGSFTSAGGHAVEGIARWKGGVWEAVPAPGDPLIRYTRYAHVSALGWYQGHLVASGETVAGKLAMLGDDGEWRALGSGLDSYAFAIAESGSSLFVGGPFSLAGGSPSYGIAEWRDPVTSGPGTPSVAAAPNPFTTDVHLRYELKADAETRVEVFDLNGRLVDRPFDGWQSAGPHDVVWHPSATGVKGGIYFARVTVAGRSDVVRVARVK